MTSGKIFFALSLSIFLPIITSIFVYNKIDRHRFPILLLLICTCMSLAMEIVAYTHLSREILYLLFNIYALAEFMLLRTQLYLWSKSDDGFFPFKEMAVMIICWAVLIFLYEGLFARNTYFIILYSFALIVSSMKMLSNVIFTNRLMAKNFFLIMSVSFGAYYSFAIIVEIICKNYYLVSVSFITYVFYIKSIVNVLFNIMLTIALLCIPRKQQYTVSF